MVRYGASNMQQTDAGSVLATGAIRHSEDILFEASCTVLGDITCDRTVIANHALTVLGSVTADTVRVKGHLVSIRDLSARSVVVDGDLVCLGRLKADNVVIGGRAFAAESVVAELTVDRDLIIMSTAEIQECAKVGGSVLCGDMLLGQGEVKAAAVMAVAMCECVVVSSDSVDTSESANVVGAHSEVPAVDLDDTSGYELLCESRPQLEDMLSRNMSLARRACEVVADALGEAEDELDFEAMLKRLQEMTEYIPGLAQYQEAFSRAISMADLSRIDTVEQLIELLDLKRTTPEELRSVTIVKDLLGPFLNKQLRRVERLRMESYTRDDLVKYLHLLELNAELLREGQYDRLFISLLKKLVDTVCA